MTNNTGEHLAVRGTRYIASSAQSKKEEVNSIWYAFPLVMMLFATNFDIQVQRVEPLIAVVDSSLYRQVILGGIYLFSGLLVLRKFYKAGRIFNKQLLYGVFLACVLVSMIWSDYPYKVFISFVHMF